MAKEQKKPEEQRPAVAEQERVPTFSIPLTDPFVEPVVRLYARIAKKPIADVNARPFVLRADDPAALDCLRSYRQRADGAGDKTRTAIVDEAIAKFTPAK